MQTKRSLKKKSFKASFKSADMFSKSKVIRQRVPEFSGRDRKRSTIVGYSQARRQGGAMDAKHPPPHGPKRSAWKEPKTKEKNAKDESFLLIC